MAKTPNRIAAIVAENRKKYDKLSEIIKKDTSNDVLKRETPEELTFILGNKSKKRSSRIIFLKKKIVKKEKKIRLRVLEIDANQIAKAQDFDS